ncbi:coiled-coil and C2 domain-containing protein 2A [Hetaerina americana]|uniref:coiled-coil and C2 domain-containing protein 2A n=1 Tax=Hetaerina americana TaxID=62018 RepID=UPI003A7F2702
MNLTLQLDEAVVDLLVDNRAREAGEIHQTTQKHFLASLRIPVSTLRFNQRMEGTFRMSSPPVLLGYTREEIAFGSGQYSGSVRLLPITSPVPGLQPGVIYLTLFITVQPPLPALHMDFEDEHVLESIELPHVESHLRAWEMEVFRAVSRGCCPPKALVPDLVGKTVCATRFLRPIVPPPGLPLSKSLFASPSF